jgi:hypothetical protein
MTAAVGGALFKLAAQAVIGWFVDKATSPRKVGAYAALRRLATRQKVDVSYTGGTEPRRRLYGDFRAAGLDVMPAVVTGPTGSRLHRCMALSDGEIESIDAVLFNNDRIEAASYVGGPITVGPYIGYAQIFPQLGTASQSAISNATTVPGWTTEHRGDGVAYVYTFFEFSTQIWKQGAPNVIVEGKGAIIYDPRLDSSPGAAPTNPSFIAFSRTPALQLADLITWSCGGNELAANIVWSECVTAANICEEDVDIPVVPSGTTTQKRYTSSTEVYAPQTIQERDQSIQQLARAMMGICWFSGGKWHMRAGAYTAPVGTITDSDVVGDDFDIDTAKPRSSGESFNTVRGKYVESLEQSQPKGMPEVSTPAYVTEDGEVVHGDVEFLTARTVFEAERNAILLMRKSRRGEHDQRNLQVSNVEIPALGRGERHSFDVWMVEPGRAHHAHEAAARLHRRDHPSRKSTPATTRIRMSPTTSHRRASPRPPAATMSRTRPRT